MRKRKTADTLPFRPRATSGGVPLAIRYNATGHVDMAAWAERCREHDFEALDGLLDPEFGTLRYPVVPSAWTADDLRRVVALMAAILSPPATRILSLIWSLGILKLVVAGTWNGDSSPTVRLNVPGVPMQALLDFAGGDVMVTTCGLDMPIAGARGGAR